MTTTTAFTIGEAKQDWQNDRRFISYTQVPGLEAEGVKVQLTLHHDKDDKVFRAQAIVCQHKDGFISTKYGIFQANPHHRLIAAESVARYSRRAFEQWVAEVMSADLTHDKIGQLIEWCDDPDNVDYVTR